MSEKIHTGKQIKKKIEKDGRKISWLAEKMQCSISKISRICQCENFNTDILMPICLHLEHNFFNDYVEYVYKHIEKENDFLLYQFINSEIHIGKIIQKVKEDKGIKSNWIAKKIAYSPSNMQKIYTRKSINTAVLVDISIYLKFNFFDIYVDYINEQMKKKKYA